jgi:hypothetical protein
MGPRAAQAAATASREQQRYSYLIGGKGVVDDLIGASSRPAAPIPATALPPACDRYNYYVPITLLSPQKRYIYVRLSRGPSRFPLVEVLCTRSSRNALRDKARIVPLQVEILILLLKQLLYK